jgi:hypothetical protein E4_22686
MFKNNEIESKMINSLCKGESILFTGAGFSIGAKNLTGNSPSPAKELSKKISRLINIDDDEDLGYTSDVLITKNKDKILELIKLLKSEYTINDIAEFHKIIASIKFRRIYTTNYDEVFEKALHENDKICTSIDMSMSPKDYYKMENCCIHINGMIQNLDNSSLESNFKLSNSSYVSPDNFIDSEWYSIFKRDLDYCSSLVFIGYSLYDIDIEKILFKYNEELKEKTFFIVGETCSEKTIYKLSKYGYVIQKNTEYIAELIKENIDSFNKENEYLLSALQKESLIDNNDEDYIYDRDIENFLIYGTQNNLAIQKTVLDSKFKKYSVYREDVKTVFENLDNGKDISFGISDFCNGKSVFCNQLSVYFLNKGYEVYTSTNFLDSIYDDLEYLNKEKKSNILIIIDNYTKSLSEIEDFIKIKNENIKLFLTARTSDHLKELARLRATNSCEINLDFLNENEISSLIDIIDGLGKWGKRSSITRAEKHSEIETKYDRQIALAITELLKSEVIKNKVDELLQDIFKVFSKNTIFYICIFKIIGIDLDKSLLDDLVKNKEIYNTNKIITPSFKTLFYNKSGIIDGKSSLFCAWIIKNFYSSKDIMKEMHSMSDYFNTRRQDFHNSYDREKIFRSTLKFSFIERILPEREKRENLKFYYDKLKETINWLKYDPHFWLQYAMAFMTFPEKYNEAQEFLDTAYSLAKKKENYVSDSLNNQQARLYIKIARQQTNGKVCFEYFKKAHDLLNNSPDNMYKFRQMQEYVSLYNEKFYLLSKNDKKEFLFLINQSITAIKNKEDSQSDDRLRNKILESLSNIIKSSI